jgi:hypothetical protein
MAEHLLAGQLIAVLTPSRTTGGFETLLAGRPVWMLTYVRYGTDNTHRVLRSGVAGRTPDDPEDTYRFMMPGTSKRTLAADDEDRGMPVGAGSRVLVVDKEA